jgi:hypothetical protein
VVNGVSTNNLTFGSLIFEPPLASIQEFKVDNSAFAAEHGHVSGAIVNLVTRSGGDAFRGEAFEFFRNDALDARNFFEFTTPDPHPFERNQFGGSLGGPIRRGRTFFFASYEGLRQRQGVDLNSLVLSDEQRAAATDPVIRQLIPIDPSRELLRCRRHAAIRRFGAGRRGYGSLDDRRPAQRREARSAPGFYGSQFTSARVEPRRTGQQHPGFGARPPVREHPDRQRDAHFGPGLPERSAIRPQPPGGGTFPAAPLNPAEFGIGTA